jgi:hypothetical protein
LRSGFQRCGFSLRIALNFIEPLFGIFKKLFDDSARLQIPQEIQEITVALNVTAVQRRIFVFGHEWDLMKDDDRASGSPGGLLPCVRKKRKLGDHSPSAKLNVEIMLLVK